MRLQPIKQDNEGHDNRKAYTPKPGADDDSQKESRMQHLCQWRQYRLTGLEIEASLSDRIRRGIEDCFLALFLSEGADKPSGVNEMKHLGGKFTVE
jgi:hypothetical protein